MQSDENSYNFVTFGICATCTIFFNNAANFCAICTNRSSARDVPPRAAEQSFDFAEGKRKNAPLGVSLSERSRLTLTFPRIVPIWEAVYCRGGQPAEPVALFRNCQLKAGADYSFVGPPSLTVSILYHTLSRLSRGF